MKIPSIYTKETLDQIVFDLSSLRLSYNPNDEKGFKQKLLTKFSSQSAAFFLEVLENVPFEDIPKILDEFEKFLGSLRVVTLVLAFARVPSLYRRFITVFLKLCRRLVYWI